MAREEDNAVRHDVIEQIAQRVVALLEEAGFAKPEPRFVDAATLAEEFAVERDWVYAHAEELGAIRLGGPKGRLRFDRVAVRKRLGAEPQIRPLPNASVRSKRPIESAQIQRRASGRTPARSPKQHQPGGSPMMKPERHDSPSSKRGS